MISHYSGPDNSLSAPVKLGARAPSRWRKLEESKQWRGQNLLSSAQKKKLRPSQLELIFLDHRVREVKVQPL